MESSSASGYSVAISTPPIPSAFICSNSCCNSGFETAGPNHHHRTMIRQSSGGFANVRSNAVNSPSCCAAILGISANQVRIKIRSTTLPLKMRSRISNLLSDSSIVISVEIIVQLRSQTRVFRPEDDEESARACGGEGFTSEDPADCGRVVEQFLNVPGPAILQAVVDPLEPPLPPKVTADQALKFAESLVRGEPNRSKIALTALSDKVRELV